MWLNPTPTATYQNRQLPALPDGQEVDGNKNTEELHETP